MFVIWVLFVLFLVFVVILFILVVVWINEVDCCFVFMDSDRLCVVSCLERVIVVCEEDLILCISVEIFFDRLLILGMSCLV